MIDIEETNDNYTTRLVVLSKQESSLKCDFENQKIVMTSEAKNVTLEDAILHPGEINLFVKVTRDDGCDIVWTLQIKVQEHECMKNKDQTLCSGKGFCDNFSNTGSFSCRCCPGFVGKYCEERDGCYGNPCQHGGFCVDIAEGLVGTTFQCLCPHGTCLLILREPF
ncbi:sushi, von Willebrand factor type A, EGF and pentraxin domain-containing protein 1 [Trichonephila inaurata madagascariensis]|uniref:Sushi, von Willebrand factor type A, EGF and pentraxin domain-containing protein 1 n=1 Tax=Trichonephila inaurata madagascariensis TaxID=2747483 RepID=A0A8X7BRV6_9ARAC|nr:sushi, von Willebrand factor type A, EGF and pentraxin domain-containing protein 1 [Trichonephila inaurata madagascariensis]